MSVLNKTRLSGFYMSSSTGSAITAFVCMAVWVVPVIYLPFVFIVFVLLYLAHCVVLSFEVFRRYSRYRLSQKHSFLNQAVSLLALVMPYIGLLPIAQAFYAYSLFASPDNDETGVLWYKRSFVQPLLQMLMIFFGLFGVLVKVFFVSKLIETSGHML